MLLLKLKPFSWTYVQYAEGDLVGYLLAGLSLLPFVILSAVSALVIVNGSGEALAMLAGQLFNEGINAALKPLLSVPRPLGSDRADFGMPSSHAQFIFYSATFVALLVRQVFDFYR
jgi:dolichyldiphosphatase